MAIKVTGTVRSICFKDLETDNKVTRVRAKGIGEEEAAIYNQQQDDKFIEIEWVMDEDGKLVKKEDVK